MINVIDVQLLNTIKSIIKIMFIFYRVIFIIYYIKFHIYNILNINFNLYNRNDMKFIYFF